MSKKLAFSYIRMSTEAQLKGHSLTRQLEQTKSYAKEKNFELVEDLRDIGLSAHDGTNVAKGKLGEFIKAVEDGKVPEGSVLLVENLDRLSRKNTIEAFKQLTEITSRGIEVHTVSDRQIYTRESLNANPGLIFTSIGYMLRAHSESDDKSKRLKKAWKNKRDNLDGKRVLTSICPAWLTVNDDKTGFKEIPQNVQTVRKIFDLCIEEGQGAYSIARYLNQHIEEFPRFSRPRKGNRSPSGKHITGWQKSYIQKILQNTSVHGEFCAHEMHNKKRQETEHVYENYFPAVITKERFLLAQAKKKERFIGGGGRKGDTFRNVFTKLVSCAHCGGAVHHVNKGKPPKGGRYLRCYNAEFRHKCDCAGWPYEDFEKNFFAFVAEVEFDAVLRKGTDKSQKTKLIEEKQTNAQKLENNEIGFNKILDLQEKSSEALSKRLEEKLEKYTSERISLENRQKEIETELSNVESRLSNRTQKELIDAIEQQQQTADLKERASIRRKIHSQIVNVIEKITMHNHSGVFYFSEVSSAMSPGVRDVLIDKGYDTEYKIISLFDNNQGRHLYDEMERYFIVHFKNGETRRVHPYVGMSWKHEADKVLPRLTKNIKEREAKEALAARKKASTLLKKQKKVAT